MHLNRLFNYNSILANKKRAREQESFASRTMRLTHAAGSCEKIQAKLYWIAPDRWKRVGMPQLLKHLKKIMESDKSIASITRQLASSVF